MPDAPAGLHLLGDRLVVGRHYQCGTVLGGVSDQCINYAPGCRAIELARRLVGQEQASPAGQGSGYGHPLRLASRELVGQPVRQLIDTQ